MGKINETIKRLCGVEGQRTTGEPVANGCRDEMAAVVGGE